MTGINRIDLNLLVALQALLEERNLTRAGHRLSMSQPAMSVALARLRRHFGDELLVRSGRQYLLTPAAERLLPALEQALGQVEKTLAGSLEFDPATSTRRLSLAMSDYSVAVLGEPLLRRVRELAPGVCLELRPVTLDRRGSDRGLLQHDLLIAPIQFRSADGAEVICRDRFVCLADPGNPALRDRRLTLQDLGALPHAAATLSHAETDPVGRVLDGLGVARNIRVTTAGWLPLPFMVAGTDMVAVVPERLARRVAAAAGVAIAEPPFGYVELVEAAWWHPARTADPALAWLRGVLAEAARS